MIPKIHAKGKSFAGCARYILHDKGASTDERVEWHQTRNLATQNPEAAWRVMAKTAMEQDELKREAGIPNTGRKSKDHVLHATLSWHEEEAEELTRDEKLRAANWFLQKIGAADRQALIVSHNDEPQPHVHIMVNRVCAKDGRMLPSSFEKLKASRWAEQYERERGKIYCNERVLNNAARDRGEFVRGEKDQARHIKELEKLAGNDPEKLKLLEKERERVAEIARNQRLTQERHAEETQRQRLEYQQAQQQHAEWLKREEAVRQTQVREEFRGRWEELYFERQAAKAEFDLYEQRFMGRARNAIRSIDWASLVGRGSDEQDGRAGTLGEAFQVFADEGKRYEILRAEHDRREEILHQEQIAREQAERQRLMQEAALREEMQRRRFLQQQSDRELCQQMDNAKIRAEWKTRGQERRQDWPEPSQAPELSPDDRKPPESRTGPQTAGAENPDSEEPPKAEDSRNASQSQSRVAANDNRPPGADEADETVQRSKIRHNGKQDPPTRASDLVPQEGAEERAAQIDTFKEKMREQRAEQSVSRDNERDRTD